MPVFLSTQERNKGPFGMWNANFDSSNNETIIDKM